MAPQERTERAALAARVRADLAKHGPIPQNLLDDLIRPALKDAATAARKRH